MERQAASLVEWGYRLGQLYETYRNESTGQLPGTYVLQKGQVSPEPYSTVQLW